MTSAIQRPSEDPIGVLVVDSDRRVRRSLSCLIDLADGLACRGAAADGPSALDALDHLDDGTAEVCLIDPRLPEVADGVALIADLRTRWPEMRIVAMSIADAEQDVCISVGADAFVAKSDEADELVDVVRAVAGRSR